MTKLWLRGKIFFEMVINEIFYSLQGEGLLAGVPAIFIRLAGCPLRCKWCDTKYALDPSAGEDLNVSAIIDKVEQWDCEFVVITGGEPMVNAQLPQLSAELKKQGKHITIETAGIAFIEGLACDLMSISPKTSNSGQTRLRLRASPRRETENQAVKQLIEHYPYQLKFVVESPEDLPEIQQAIEQLGNVESGRIMLMPQAKTRDELIAKAPMVAELCKQAGFVFCNRLQILLYDGARGK
jgi:7-carboxy-7-deazaguanine synthase